MPWFFYLNYWPICKGNLTKNNKDEEWGSHSCCDVKHNADVMSQLVHVVHIRYKDRRHKEPNGNTQLQDKKTYTYIKHKLNFNSSTVLSCFVLVPVVVSRISSHFGVPCFVIPVFLWKVFPRVSHCSRDFLPCLVYHYLVLPCVLKSTSSTLFLSFSCVYVLWCVYVQAFSVSVRVF